MDAQGFELFAHELLDHAEKVRIEKAAHYATDSDRLSNFRKAASLTGSSLPIAVSSMMVKHTVSIYDMVDNVYGKDPLGKYNKDLWLEKLGDQINYLLLLYAAIQETETNATPLYEEDK